MLVGYRLAERGCALFLGFVRIKNKEGSFRPVLIDSRRAIDLYDVLNNMIMAA